MQGGTLISVLEKERGCDPECAQGPSLCLAPTLASRAASAGLAPTPGLGLTLNWRRRLAISYSRCSSMPRRRHHFRELLLRSDFTWEG